jgi:ribose 5-phosphate isomerase B
MKIALGSDHRGYNVKSRLVGIIRSINHEVIDTGTNASEPATDYPDYALPVAEMVARGEADRGILICGTGFGMCIAANKVHGIRAVSCRDPIEAELARRHNDANILCMSPDFLSQELIDRMVKIFLTTEFEGGRHTRRLDKIRDYEKKH